MIHARIRQMLEDQKTPEQKEKEKYCHDQASSYMKVASLFTGGAIASVAVGQPLGGVGFSSAAFFAMVTGSSEYQSCMAQESHRHGSFRMT